MKNKYYIGLTTSFILSFIIFMESCGNDDNKQGQSIPRHLNILIIHDLSDRISNSSIKPNDSIVITGIVNVFADSVKEKLGSKSSIYYVPLSELPVTPPNPIDLCTKFGPSEIAQLQRYVKDVVPDTSLTNDLNQFKNYIFSNLKFKKARIDIPSQIKNYINDKKYVKQRNIENLSGRFVNKVFLITDGYCESGNENDVSQSHLSDIRNKIISNFPNFKDLTNKDEIIKNFIIQNNLSNLGIIPKPQDTDIELFFLETTSRDASSQLTTNSFTELSDNNINRLLYEIWAEKCDLKFFWVPIEQFQTSYNQTYFLDIFK